MSFFYQCLCKDKVQDNNLNRLQLKIFDNYKKAEKITTNFKPSNDEDVIKKLSKIEAHLSLLEEDYNECKTLSNKHFTEEVLIQTVVKTTIQILYDKGLFDKVPNADKVLKGFLLVERRRFDLDEVNDVIQWFLFINKN